MLLSDQKAILVLKLLSCNFLHDVQSNLAPNVALLKQVGVPQLYISIAVLKYPHIMSTETHRFDDSVKEVLKMGFDPSKVCFVQALSVICGQSKLSWEHKKVVYKRWGWSDHEISFAFRKHPLCMIKSESKIMNVMDFLVNKMGFQSSAIVRAANVLYYSLEKRIIPRCSVVRFLVLKGLLNKVPTLVLSLMVPDFDSGFNLCWLVDVQWLRLWDHYRLLLVCYEEEPAEWDGIDKSRGLVKVEERWEMELKTYQVYSLQGHCVSGSDWDRLVY
ncbi:hypothetical protein RJ639_004036 [Escallonia herrerae]|uniref:Mitochondrial transcription termination factor family protein n=1 Tax=Escallonia herrerae TaxID=1293975 RepID=A0AA88W4R2_9ASTE|nr:hypothetical protein RJ639_004036 [Escallonia herrerae]